MCYTVRTNQRKEPMKPQDKPIETVEQYRQALAAPDLLEAIKDLLNLFEQRGVLVDPQHPDRIAVEKARAAIFKATGK